MASSEWHLSHEFECERQSICRRRRRRRRGVAVDQLHEWHYSTGYRTNDSTGAPIKTELMSRESLAQPLRNRQ